MLNCIINSYYTMLIFTYGQFSNYMIKLFGIKLKLVELAVDVILISVLVSLLK